MQTKMKGLWEKVKGFFKKLNKLTRIILGVCVVVILAAIIYAAAQMNKVEYVELCNSLTASETSAVVGFLNDKGVTDYKISGDRILVPAGRETQLQVEIVTSRLLNNGFLYETYFDKTGSFSTEAERKEAMRIATEEKLAAMIRTFDGIRDAQVNINLGTDRNYVLDPQTSKSTATVLVTPESNQLLSSDMVESIRYLVSHSVKELDIGDVAISDTYGNPYTGNGTAQSSDASALKLQFEQETNNKVRHEVLEALESIYGPGNVKVAVNTTVNVDRQVIEDTTYSQPEGAANNGGLIGSQKYFWEIIREDGIEATGGVVGAGPNSDIENYPDIDTELNGNENLATGSGEIDHNVNTTVTQREVLAGTVTDVKVAVTINQNSPNAGALTVDQLVDHVGTASGIGAIDRNDPISVGRVSVVLAPFFEEDAEPPVGPVQPGEILPGVPNWMIYAAAGGLLLFVILVILIILLLRRRKRKKLEKQLALEAEQRAAEEAAAEEAAAAAAVAAVIEAAPTGGADIMEVNTEKSMELRKMVRQFAQNNPEIAAQMVKTWLKGESDDG